MTQDQSRAEQARQRYLESEQRGSVEKRPNASPSIRERTRAIFSSKWLKIVGGVVLGIIVLVVLFSFLGSGSPEPTRIQNTQPPKTVPTFQPTSVDYKSVSVVGTTLLLLIEGLILVPILGILDGKERFQVSDVVFAIVSFLVNYIVIWAPILAFLTAFSAIGNPKTAMFFVTGVTLTAVLIKALTGGRDTTNLGVFFAILGFAGAIWGSMGAIQVALSVPSQPVYLLQDLPSAFTTKQVALVQYSILVYTMFFLSMVCYLIDIFLPKDKEIRWESLMTAAVVVLGYFLANIKMAPTYSLLVATAVAVLLATVVRRAGKGITTGENPLSRAVSRAFEYTAWDGVAFGIVFTILLRLTLA